MSDKMRWRYGDTNPVVAAVAKETIIEIGDLLWQDDDDEAKPASDCESVETFKQLFLGVAMQRSRKGDSSPIRVATTGVFEFDCSQDTRWALGVLVTPAINPRLLNQRVAITIERAYAIGRIAKRKFFGEPIVLVAIQSTVMTGGV